MSHGPSAELAALAEAMRSLQPALETSSLSDQRASVEALAMLWPVADDAEVVESEVAGVPCEHVAVLGAAADRVVLHLHGGGYVMGSGASHRSLAARLSGETGATVVVPSYRLAPEQPFPAAVDDALAVYRALVQAVDPRRLVVSGDSAGGGLALSCMLAARSEGLGLPAAAVCWSPWVDLAAVSTWRASDAGEVEDPVLSTQWLDEAAAQYLGGTDPAHPLASPLGADLSGLPPLLVMVGEIELLRPQARLLGEAAQRAGVEIEVEVYPGAVHWWMVLAPDAPESLTSLRRAGAFIRSKTA